MKHLIWIDWMKSIGMFLIVWGHFSPCNRVFLYTFSVPLFFLISGFLFHKENSKTVFWSKLFWNLIIPMVIITFIIQCYYSLSLYLNNKLYFQDLCYLPIDFLLGFHEGVKLCWFIYTLVLLKIIQQFLPNNTWFSIATCMALTCVDIILLKHIPSLSNETIDHNSSAILNTCVAYPFFYIGYLLRKKKESLEKIKIGNKELTLFTLPMVSILCIIAHYNGLVCMHLAGYGNHFLLFIIGGVTGSCFIFIVSKWCEQWKNKMTSDISMGTIVILGFHFPIVVFIARQLKELTEWSFLIVSCLSSVTIIVCFIPIINLLKTYFPIILGKYRIEQR